MTKTKIEWTEYSWNPIRARDPEDGKIGWHCEIVTPGCERCYAATINKRLGTGWLYRRDNRDRTQVYLDEKILSQPLRWRSPKMVFVMSMSDLFGEWVPDEMISAVVRIMESCPQHTFQVLTKRHERMREYFDGFRPLPNVWLGVSVEDQRRADERIPELLRTAAAVHWISLEPQLDEVFLYDEWIIAVCAEISYGSRLDWIVVGGESGPGSRPFNIEWARSIIAQCKAAGVPVFCKQLGAHPIIEDPSPFNGGFPDGTFFGNRTGIRELNGREVLLRDRKGGDPAEWSPDLRVREYPWTGSSAAI